MAGPRRIPAGQSVPEHVQLPVVLRVQAPLGSMEVGLGEVSRSMARSVSAAKAAGGRGSQTTPQLTGSPVTGPRHLLSHSLGWQGSAVVLAVVAAVGAESTEAVVALDDDAANRDPRGPSRQLLQPSLRVYPTSATSA